MLQHRAVTEEVAQLVRAERAACGNDRPVGDKGAQRVIAETIRGERTDFIRPGVDAHLAEVRRRRADRIGGHDMVDHGVATFRDAVAEADRAIGVEGLALDVEVVRGDLGQSAAERMAGDGDFGWALSEILPLLLGIGEGALGQRDGVRCLDVGAGDNHATIGQDRIAGDLFGAAMCDDNFIGVDSLVDRSLITVQSIINVLEDLVLMPVDRYELFLAGSASTDRTVLVHVVGNTRIVLAAEAHWRTSLASSEAENSEFCSSGRNLVGSSWPLAP